MSASPTKESSPAKAEKPLFTEKEERALKVAWFCLKNTPEIDIEKLAKHGGFNTTKTASNTWGVIKKKLASIAPATEEDEDGATPMKTKATPKKRGKKTDVDDDDDEATPTKKRKTPKKKVVKAAADDDEVVNDEDMFE